MTPHLCFALHVELLVSSQDRKALSSQSYLCDPRENPTYILFGFTQSIPRIPRFRSGSLFADMCNMTKLRDDVLALICRFSLFILISITLVTILVVFIVTEIS